MNQNRWEPLRGGGEGEGGGGGGRGGGEVYAEKRTFSEPFFKATPVVQKVETPVAQKDLGR